MMFYTYSIFLPMGRVSETSYPKKEGPSNFFTRRKGSLKKFPSPPTSFLGITYIIKVEGGAFFSIFCLQNLILPYATFDLLKNMPTLILISIELINVIQIHVLTLTIFRKETLNIS